MCKYNNIFYIVHVHEEMFTIFFLKKKFKRNVLFRIHDFLIERQIFLEHDIYRHFMMLARIRITVKQPMDK